MNSDSTPNILLGIFVIIILIAVIFYFNQSNQYPVPNDGSIINFTDNQFGNQTTTDYRNMIDRQTGLPQVNRPVRPPILNNRRADEINGDLVSNTVSQYSVENRPMEGGTGSFIPSDPMSDTHGSFNNYGHKKQLNMIKMEEPYSDDIYDARDYSYRLHRLREQRGDGINTTDAVCESRPILNNKKLRHKKNKLRREIAQIQSQSDSDIDDSADDDANNFVYRKRQYTKRTPEDIKDQFNSQAMLPQEIEDTWFDVEPLLTTKRIQGTQLIHPKVHMGINTVGSTLRNGTHDLRGDIPNPKINVSPWNNSTIEPDTNIKGICTTI
jgi:hypothetical protein